MSFVRRSLRFDLFFFAFRYFVSYFFVYFGVPSQVDVTKLDTLVAGLKGVTTVIHTASPPHGKGYDLYYAGRASSVLGGCDVQNATHRVLILHRSERGGHEERGSGVHEAECPAADFHFLRFGRV